MMSRETCIFLLSLIAILKIVELKEPDICDDNLNSISDEGDLLDGTQQILKILDQEQSSVRNSEIVVVFGSKNSDKTVLVELITGLNNNLIYDNSEGHTQFLNSNWKHIQEPSLSNLLKIDVIEGTPYLEFPAFKKHSTFLKDLTSKYFVWRIINQARSLKFVLTTKCSSENGSIINATDFSNLVNHVTSFLPNIEKFKNSFALVVTDVEKHSKAKSSALKDKIVENLSQVSLLLSMNGNNKGSKLIHNLLNIDKASNSERIEVISKSDENGLATDLTLLQYEKRAIKSMIKNAIIFSPKVRTDFNYGYNAHRQSDTNNIQFLLLLEKSIQKRIINVRCNVQKQILRYFESIEENTIDIKELKDSFASAMITLNFIRNAEVNNWNESNHFLQINRDKSVIKKLADLSRLLKMGISEEMFLNMLHSYKYLEFLEEYCSCPIQSYLENWEMKQIEKYIRDSKIWYTFLNDLQYMLSDYEVQKRREKNIFNIKQIEDFCVNKLKIKNLVEELKYFEETYKPYKHETKEYQSFEMLNDVNMNDVKLKYLCKIYEQTLLQKLEQTCFENTLQMKGDFIRFDQIPPSNYCDGGIKRLELFAFDTLFINTDLIRIGEELEVIAIAPKWVVLDKRDITLDGAPGKAYEQSKAPNSYTPGFDGEDGQPGLPGGPAGNFLGISSKIVSISNAFEKGTKYTSRPEKYIFISAIGGNGGNGQDGGDGAKGKDGIRGTTTFKETYSSISSYGDIPEQLRECPFYGIPAVGYYCLINEGAKGYPSGDGGDGGKGGLPGSAGNILIFTPSYSSTLEIITHNQGSIGGKGGAGGLGGEGSKYGITTYSIYNKQDIPAMGRYHSRTTFKRINTTDAPVVILPRGKNGQPDINKEGMESPKTPQPTQFSQSVNKYRILLRERMVTEARQDELNNFYNVLHNLGSVAQEVAISEIDDTLALVDELQGLEEQFFKLHSKVDFLPFYTSLLQRVEIYARNPKSGENNNEYKKVLIFLYTAILSKICIIKDESLNGLIIDIKKHLDFMTANVQEISEATNEMKRNEINQNFKSNIDNKIVETKQFVKSIEAEIHKINKQMMSELKILTNRTIVQELSAERKLKMDQEQVKRVKNRVVLRGVFDVLKAVSSLVSFCGPWGTIASGLLESGLKYSEPFALKTMSEVKTRDFVIRRSMDIVVAGKKHVEQITDQLWKSQHETMKKNIESLKNKERELPELKETRKKLEDLTAEKSLSDKSTLDEAQETISEEKQKLNSALDNLKNKTDIYKKKKEVFDYLGKLEKINRISKSGFEVLDVYNNINSNSEIDQVYGEINKDINTVRKLDNYQDDIRGMIMPMLRSMKSEVDNIEKSLGSKSQVALDITKWQIQQTLSNIKARMKAMTKDFPQVSEVFGNLIQKIMDALNTLINVYDRMQQYQDRKVLVDYIAQINSPNLRNLYIDKKLNYALSYLKVILDTNEILDPYERTMNAFKQYAFPFAQFYIAEFSLPPDLEIQDMRGVRSSVIYQMTRINKNLDKTFISVVPGIDDLIHEGEFSTANKFNGPFFTWKNTEHKFLITEILAGKKVILGSNIKKGLQQNAVKFRSIKLEFIATNSELQKELDQDLENFQVTMTHTGNSYYRCGGKYYIITSSRQTFSYTIQTHSDTVNNIQKSLSYEKLQRGDFVLSPYTFWEIQLKGNSKSAFEVLLRYRFQVTIALSGYGQYVDAESHVCDPNLHKYYKEETNIFEHNELYDIDDYEYINY